MKLWTNWARPTPLAGRILRSYREFQEGVAGWQAISEGSYLSARDS